MKKLTAAQATVIVLKRTENTGVSAQDWCLLSMIDEELGYRYSEKCKKLGFTYPAKYAKKMIDAIDYSNKGELIKGVCGFERKVRTFWLPEYAPDWAKK